MALSITARLGLDGSGFRAGVQKAKGAVSGLKKYVSKEMITAGAAMAGAFAVAQIGVQVAKTIEWGARIRDLALQFGVTTGFVQKMDYAFKQTGTDAEVAFKAIRKMALNASIAMNPLTSAMTAQVKLDAFGKLGISAQQLKGMGTEKLFMLIAKNLKDANYASADLHDALNVVFGKAGSQLLVTFGNDLEKMSARMEELGLVDDAAIQRLGMLGDKLEEFKTQNRGVWADIVDAATGLWMKLVNLLTSTIDTLSARLVKLGSGLTDLASAAMNTFKGVASGDVSRIVSATKDLKSAKDNLIGAVAGEEGVKAFDSSIKSLFQGDIGGAYKGLTGAVARALTPFDELMEVGERSATKEAQTEQRLQGRQGQQELDEEVKASAEIEKERLKNQEAMEALEEKAEQRRFNALSTEQQLLHLQKELVAERAKLAEMPFYSEEQIKEATKDLEGLEATQTRAAMEAANLEYKEQEAAVTDSYDATAKAKEAVDSEAEKAKAKPVDLVGEAQFSQLARIGGKVGGRNPVLDMAKKQLNETEQMRISLETSTKCLTTLSGVK
tara:strand:- start:1062 stop:2729 length:1668 start_codon:yes stop_codon:yes gene_type:complete